MYLKACCLGQVYPEGGNVAKPELGEGLNKPAEVTLNNLFKLDKEGNRTKDAEQQRRFERKLKTSASKQNTQFVSYDSEQGIWKFRVEHFSKYVFTSVYPIIACLLLNMPCWLQYETAHLPLTAEQSFVPHSIQCFLFLEYAIILTQDLSCPMFHRHEFCTLWTVEHLYAVVTRTILREMRMVHIYP